MSYTEEIIEAISSFVDYLKIYSPQTKERDTAIIKLEEAVFWLTYELDQ